VILLMLRPDPLHVLARRRSEESGEPAADLRVGRRPGARERFARMIAELRANRRARTALVALLTSQVVMVSLMTMTPVHIAHQGGSLSVVGVTISLHVLGMFGLAPVVGHLVDRLGHRAVAGIGLVLFAFSLGLAVLASETMGGVIASLILLGLGWSFLNVAGSALFSTVIADSSRASAQGGADALSNLCGATAAFLAGPLMAATGFPALGILAAVVMIPIVLLVLRPSAWAGPGTTAATTAA